MEMTRQQRRKMMKGVGKETKQRIAEGNKPVKKIEFIAYVQYLETVIATMDAFLNEKYSDEYVEFTKKKIEEAKQTQDSTEETPSEE